MNTTQQTNNKYQPVSIMNRNYVNWINQQLKEITDIASTVASKPQRGVFFMPGRNEDIRVAVIFSHIDNYREMAAFSAAHTHFYQAYGDKYDIIYTAFSGENSHEYLAEHTIEQVVALAEEGEIDACITFSNWTTMALKTALIQAGEAYMPIIFGGMVNPEALGFTKDPKKGNHMVTGVVLDTPSFDRQVKTIKSVHPTAHELLLPYDTGLGLGGNTEATVGVSKQFGDEWAKNGGKVSTLPINAYEDIGSSIARVANDDTMVNFSTESSMLVQTAEIVEKCNKRGIPLFAHDRTSVRRGVALGTGSSGAIFGPGIAACLAAVCVEGRDLDDLPLITVRESDAVCFQRHALVPQGVEVGADDMLKLDMVPIEYVE